MICGVSGGVTMVAWLASGQITSIDTSSPLSLLSDPTHASLQSTPRPMPISQVQIKIPSESAIQHTSLTPMPTYNPQQPTWRWVIGDLILSPLNIARKEYINKCEMKIALRILKNAVIENIERCDMTQRDRRWRVVTESEATRRHMSAAFVILARKKVFGWKKDGKNEMIIIINNNYCQCQCIDNVRVWNDFFYIYVWLLFYCAKKEVCRVLCFLWT